MFLEAEIKGKKSLSRLRLFSIKSYPALRKSRKGKPTAPLIPLNSSCDRFTESSNLKKKSYKSFARPEGFKPPTLGYEVVSVPNKDKRVSKTYYESPPIPTLSASPIPAHIARLGSNSGSRNS
jgi:hypothetical protein